MLKKEKKPDRFVCVSQEGSELSDKGQRAIFVDRETGVNYLYIKTGYSGGLTVMVDGDGKPIVTPVQDQD